MKTPIRPPGWSPAGTPPPSRTATVTRHGQYVLVSPVIPALQRDLYTVSHGTDPVTRGIVAAPSPLLWEVRDAGPPALCGLAGLQPVIHDWLACHNHAVAVAGDAPPPLAEPRLDWMHNRGIPVDAPFLDFVRGLDRGLVRYEPSRVDPIMLIGQAARAWPAATVLVTVHHSYNTRAYGRRLRALVPKAQIIDTPKLPAGTNRVTVAADAWVGEGVLDLERRDLWFALDPAQMFSPAGGHAMAAMRGARNARLFGFLSADAALAPRLQSFVAAAFGQASLRLLGHGRRRQVDVVFLPVRGGPPLEKIPRDAYELKRDGVTAHPVRNRRLVRLVTHLAAGDAAAVRADFPQLAGMADDRLRGRVGVRVENLPHAEALLACGLDAPVLGPPAPAAVKADFPRVEAARRRRSAAGVVVVIGEPPADCAPFDILINADPTAAFSPAPDPESLCKNRPAGATGFAGRAMVETPPLYVTSVP